VNKITYVYSSTYYKNYIEIPDDNRVLIGYDKKSLGVGTTDGNIVTGLNPTELLNKDNLVLNIKLDDFKYESRKLRRLEVTNSYNKYRKTCKNVYNIYI
jgi:hypothetical protein